MKVNSEDKLQKAQSLVSDLATLEYRFNELLEGFKLYNKYKGTLEIEVYEKSLKLFNQAIDAMEETMLKFARLSVELTATLQ
jgi:hypothetical protein